MTAWWLRLVPHSWQTEPLTPGGRPASARPSVLVTREAHAAAEPEAESG
jgi:hypothetical protein